MVYRQPIEYSGVESSTIANKVHHDPALWLVRCFDGKLPPTFQIPLNFGQVCCRVLSAECSSTVDKDEDGENPRWRLVGVLLPPFLHGLCMCVDRPRIAEGMLPPLVSGFAIVFHIMRFGSSRVVRALPTKSFNVYYLFFLFRCYRCAFRRYSHVASTRTPARRQLHQEQKRFCVRPS